MPRLADHRRWIADTPRLDAFTRALRQVIQPHHRVLDLGAGTGILSFLACSAGAAHVYAVDDGSIAGLARELARRNGFEGRVDVIREHSERVTLPERVDVVVCDQIGRMGVDAGLRQYMLDARDRLAKTDATLVPRTIEVWVAPCESAELRGQIGFWEAKPAGLSWEPVSNIVRASVYSETLAAGSLLAQGACVAAVSLATDDGRAVRGSTRFVVERAGTFDAVASWFRAELADGIWISNGPLADRIDRRMTLLPVSPSVAVIPGHVVETDVRIDTQTTGISWNVRILSPDGVEVQRIARSTFESLLLSAEDLARDRNAAAPRLSRLGTLRRRVLELCDGLRTQKQIEAELFEFNRDVFSTLADASRFVTEALQPNVEP